MVEVAISYFEKLYTTSQPNRIQEVVNAIDPKVSVEMNQSLIKQFTREEVEATPKEMHLTKSHGLDGMSAIFYQKYWNIVGNDVACMVLNVLNSNMSMADIKKNIYYSCPKN